MFKIHLFNSRHIRNRLFKNLQNSRNFNSQILLIQYNKFNQTIHTQLLCLSLNEIVSQQIFRNFKIFIDVRNTLTKHFNKFCDKIFQKQKHLKNEMRKCNDSDKLFVETNLRRIYRRIDTRTNRSNFLLYFLKNI